MASSGWVDTDVFTTIRLQVLAVIAGTGTVIRGVGNFSLVDLAELIGEGLFLALAVAVSGGFVGEALSEATTWLLYVFALYLFLPGLGPRSITNLFEDRQLRLLVTVGVIVCTVPAARHFGHLREQAGGPAIDPMGPSIGQSIFFAFLAVIVATWLYLRFFKSIPVHEDENVEELFDRYGKDSARILFGNRFVRVLDEFALAGTFAVLALLLSAVISIMIVLYPLPELAFVTGGLWVSISRRVDSVAAPTSSISPFDLEGRLGNSMGELLRSPRGHYIAQGTFFTGLAGVHMFLMAIAGIDDARRALTSDRPGNVPGDLPVVLEPFAQFALIGACLTLFVTTLCVFWALIRIGTRSGGYVTAYEHHIDAVPGTAPEPSTSRPVDGLILPLVVSAVAVMVFQHYWASISLPLSQYTMLGVYGLVWPLGLVAIGFWIWDTIKREPQPSLADDWLHPGLGILSLGWMIIILLSAGLGPRSVLPFAVFAIILVIFSYHLELNRWRKQEGEPWYALVQGLTLIVPMVALAIVFPPYAPILFGVAAVLGVLFILLMIEDKRRRDTEDQSIPDSLVNKYRREIEDVDNPVQVLIPPVDLPEPHEQSIYRAFKNVAGRWQRLSEHPNIVDVHRVETEDRPWMAIEPTDNTLADRSESPSVENLQTVFQGILQAISAAHEEGYIHGDLRPEHVGLGTTEDGVKSVVGDWGLERTCQLAARNSYTTAYTAPELHEGKGDEDIEIDIYGVGALLYDVLIGHPPLELDSDESDIARNQLEPSGEVVSGLPDDLEEILDRSLSKQPADRYQSANSLLEVLIPALESIVDEQDTLPLSTEESIVMPGTQSTAKARPTSMDEDSVTGAGVAGGINNFASPSFSRRNVLSFGGICAFGAIGYTVPHMGGMQNPLIPDSIQYAVHSREGTPQWSYMMTDESMVSPVVNNQTVYTTCSDGTVYAVDTDYGTERWVTDSDPDGNNTWIATGEETVAAIVGSTLYTFDTDGTERWQWPIDQEASNATVVIEDGTVYITEPLYDVSELYALDATDGTELWHRSLSGGGTEPLVTRGYVLIRENGDLVAIDQSDGSLHWSTESSINPVDIRSPVVGEDRIFVFGGVDENSERFIAAIDIDDGTVDWSIGADDANKAIAATEDNLYVSGLDHVRAVSASNGNENWRVEIEGVLEDTAFGQRSLYVSEEDPSQEFGIIKALNIETGGQRWSFESDNVAKYMTVGESNLYLTALVGPESVLYSIGTND